MSERRRVTVPLGDRAYDVVVGRGAVDELAAQHEFAEVVRNDRLDDAVDELEAIVRQRVKPA